MLKCILLNYVNSTALWQETGCKLYDESRAL